MLLVIAAAELKGVLQILADGGLAWSIYVGSVVSSPAIGEDGTIYFGSGDRNVWAVTDGGMTRWRYTTPMPVVASAHCTSDAVYIGDRNGTMYKVRGCGFEEKGSARILIHHKISLLFPIFKNILCAVQSGWFCGVEICNEGRDLGHTKDDS